MFKDKNKNVKFDDGTSFNFESDEGLSYKDIVLSLIKKVANSASCEFRGGFYTFIETKGGMKEVYVSDTRETYSNSVYCVAQFLQPKFDDIMKGTFKKFNRAVKIAEAEFMNKSSVKENIILGESFYTDKRDKALLEQLKNRKLLYHKKLFGALILHLERLDWLATKGLED